jgi:hypothetical protein
VPAIVEGPHRAVDFRPRERELERRRVPDGIERPARLRAEDVLVVALVGGSRPDLLRWSRWGSKAKEYLRGLPADEIDLGEVVAEYGRTVTEFYDWFGFACRERTLDPFRRLQRLEEAHRASLAELDASRARSA